MEMCSSKMRLTQSAGLWRVLGRVVCVKLHAQEITLKAQSRNTQCPSGTDTMLVEDTSVMLSGILCLCIYTFNLVSVYVALN